MLLEDILPLFGIFLGFIGIFSAIFFAVRWNWFHLRLFKTCLRIFNIFQSSARFQRSFQPLPGSIWDPFGFPAIPGEGFNWSFEVFFYKWRTNFYNSLEVSEILSDSSGIYLGSLGITCNSGWFWGLFSISSLLLWDFFWRVRWILWGFLEMEDIFFFKQLFRILSNFGRLFKIWLDSKFHFMMIHSNIKVTEAFWITGSNFSRLFDWRTYK